MNESTQQGDSVAVTNVDTAAEALIARYEQQDEAVVSDETSTEDETIEVEAEAETEIEESEPEQSEPLDASSDDAETSFKNINELADATGQSVEDFLKSINMTTKVNGEEKEVSLADIKKGYQLESDYTRKNEAFLTEQKQWESDRADAQTKLNDELQRTGQAFRVAQDQLTHEFNAINWGELEQSDPSAFLIQRQKFGERQAQMENAINNANQHAQNVLQQQNAQEQTRKESNLKQQDDLLLKAIPEWSDSKIRSEQAQAVGEFLLSNGFNQDEVANITDHRVILMARNAMKGVKSVSNVDLALKKVKTVPKLLKPNARQDNQNAQRQTKLHKTLRKTGRVEDVAALLENKWSN